MSAEQPDAPASPDETPVEPVDAEVEASPDTPASEADGDERGDLLDRIPWYTVPALLLGVPALFAIIGQISPWFADNVIWKYYWGPIFADAARQGAQMQNGVIAEPGYNAVNTISWAVLLGVCVLGIAQMINRFKQVADSKLILGASAWVVTGAVWHVLQDTRLILPPLEYLFITPPIYLLFGAFGILSWLYGQYMVYVERETGSYENALQKAWFLFAAIVVGYTFIWVADWDKIVHYISPIWVAVSALVTFVFVRWRVQSSGRVDASEMLLLFPIGWMLVALIYVAEFVQSPWRAPGPNALPMGILWAPLLAAAVTAAVYGAGRLGKGDDIGLRYAVGGGLVTAFTLAWAVGWPAGFGGALGFVALAALIAGVAVLSGKLMARKEKVAVAAAYILPINMVLIFSQLVDGFATSLGLDLAGYTEKHVLSAFLIDWFRDTSTSLGFTFGATYPTFLAFVPVKLLISLLVVYAIDVSSEEDVKKYPTLIGLVKFAIIMVGIGPGVRDFVRLAMGV